MYLPLVELFDMQVIILKTDLHYQVDASASLARGIYSFARYKFSASKLVELGAVEKIVQQLQSGPFIFGFSEHRKQMAMKSHQKTVKLPNSNIMVSSFEWLAAILSTLSSHDELAPLIATRLDVSVDNLATTVEDLITMSQETWYNIPIADREDNCLICWGDGVDENSND